MSEEQFFSAWKIAALFHDLGYIFEVEDIRSKGFEDAIQELNDMRSYSLYHYFKARNPAQDREVILENEDQKIRDAGAIHTHLINYKQLNGLKSFHQVDLFSDLRPFIQLTGLSDEPDALFRYWRYANSHDPEIDGEKIRDKFLDHGITGALVLLQQFYSLNYHVEEAIKVINGAHNPASKLACEHIINIHDDVNGCRNSVLAAAAAIATHNINVNYWDKNRANDEENLTLNQYQLSLEHTPLAFLLALTDALQNWDRRKFSWPTPNDRLASCEDIDIRVHDKIYVSHSITFDPQNGRENSVFRQQLKDMSGYIKKRELEELLCEDSSNHETG